MKTGRTIEGRGEVRLAKPHLWEGGQEGGYRRSIEMQPYKAVPPVQSIAKQGTETQDPLYWGWVETSV